MALNEKQEMFCQQYIVDYNATQAAIRAGYSEKTARAQGSKLLTNRNVRAYIDELKAPIIEKTQLDAEWVLTRLQQISDRAMQQEPVMMWDYESKSMVETGEYKFDSNGANKATELIGKHLGMFKEVKDINMKSSVQIVDDIE